MPSPVQSPATWLRSPIKSPLGTLRMAGSLHDSSSIPPERMRLLGSYALVLMLEGNGFYADANGRSLDLRPGDAVQVFPQLAHAYGGLQGSGWKQIYVIFEGPQFDLLQEADVLDPRRPVWRLESPDLWRRRLEEIFASPARSPAPEPLLVLGRFVQLLTEMAASERAAHSHPEDAWLDESMHLLGEPQREGWLSPQDAAREVGLSYDSFRKRFAERTGQAPGKYQLQRRIDHACAEIYRGSSNFKELAESLGFCDAFHFSKVFRQVIGESPSSYRRRVRGY